MSGKQELQRLLDELFGADDDADTDLTGSKPSVPAGQPEQQCMQTDTPVTKHGSALFAQCAGPPGLSLCKDWIDKPQQVMHNVMHLF